ncbi:xanthine dehydrogenase family protein subunit M [uncultured Tateyamaria sp.]|uniref:FAD binding domain-containing protein n=1 Tax=uncultured Tateyamaria sp. TaxID=455651 RepID=UPI00260AA688|nr:xanthine dehydrogenase family protein subunit M [uncultured Tateyamaria sp.]
MKPFDFIMPGSLSEAYTVWEELGPAARLLAGGTDLTVALRHGHLATDVVIDLKGIAELKPDIEDDAGWLRVSAGTTMTTLCRYLSERALLPALQEAARVVGSIQIRNRATLAGNVCNASPAADTVPVLAALGAEVEICGPEGTRRTLITAFIEGNRQIDLQRGEIVTAVLIPKPQGRHGCAFDRITRRRGVDLATANLCCNIDDKGAVLFGLGAVSPRPLVLTDESGVMGDPKANHEDRAKAIQVMAAKARPISDVRASADYRSAMLCIMADRACKTAHARRAGGMDA